jgi:hypothetical protein
VGVIGGRLVGIDSSAVDMADEKIVDNGRMGVSRSEVVVFKPSVVFDDIYLNGEITLVIGTIW